MTQHGAYAIILLEAFVEEGRDAKQHHRSFEKPSRLMANIQRAYMERSLQVSRYLYIVRVARAFVFFSFWSGVSLLCVTLCWDQRYWPQAGYITAVRRRLVVLPDLQAIIRQ